MNSPFTKEKKREKGYCLKQLEGDLTILYGKENVEELRIQNYLGEPFRPKTEEEEKVIQEYIKKGANIVKYDTIKEIDIYNMCEKALYVVKNKAELIAALPK